MKNTGKKAALRQPHNYWINRTVWADEYGSYYVKINGMFFSLGELESFDWEVKIYF